VLELYRACLYGLAIDDGTYAVAYRMQSAPLVERYIFFRSFFVFALCERENEKQKSASTVLLQAHTSVKEPPRSSYQ